jgi:2-methylcitrate dehydratase PrpD
MPRETVVTGLGRRLGAIARGDAPQEAIEAARSRLFHGLGVALRSAALPAAEVAWRAVSHATGDCLIFGRRDGAAVDEAAFVNGVIAHSSLQEDCGPGGLRDGSHPGTYVIPAALAAAESSGASGRQLLLSVITGYEAVGRIGAVAPSEIVRRGFRPVAIMGPFGAAAAAAAVYGATDAQHASALSIAANMAGGTTQGIFEGTMEPYLHAGLSARNGLLAARLAVAGASTAAQSLEGDFGFLRAFGGDRVVGEDLGERRPEYSVTGLGTKRFAACLQNQLTIALIRAGFPGGVDGKAVERVTVCRPRTGTNGLDSPGVSRTPPFDNMLAAQMSARFTAAAAVVGAAVDDPAYFQAAFADESVTALAGRVDLVPSEDAAVSVTVALRDGTCVVLDQEMPGLLFPTADEIRDGFIRRVGPVIGVDAADEVAGMLDNLHELSDVRELTGALRFSTVAASGAGSRS